MNTLLRLTMTGLFLLSLEHALATAGEEDAKKEGSPVLQHRTLEFNPHPDDIVKPESSDTAVAKTGDAVDSDEKEKETTDPKAGNVPSSKGKKTCTLL